ncbi:methylated-DNA--[protein]-cysteine S-methyltransferase [Polaromonas jejuensis]|uniref:Methylated-DNA--[protein]-cysteine S-methyltransferase n=1 Tax=Polaromonas jejuensis TaxID=457502 RepID=A0ABW0QB86_9BURK|nr:MGMT family protein [Polaromonas jejuensis]
MYEITPGITPGKTQTYGDIAALLAEPGATRVAGQALGHNPFPIIMPCHRILAAGAQSGGFSAPGGVTTRLRKLLIEGAEMGGAPGFFDRGQAIRRPAPATRPAKNGTLAHTEGVRHACRPDRRQPTVRQKGGDRHAPPHAH